MYFMEKERERWKIKAIVDHYYIVVDIIYMYVVVYIIIIVVYVIKFSYYPVGSTLDWSHVTKQIGMFCFSGLSAEKV